LILLDTSGVLAALFHDQRHHRECARALSAASRRILSPFVFAELDYFIQKYGGVRSELLFMADVSKAAYELAPFGRDDVAKAMDIIQKYRELKIGLADASIVILATRYDTRDVLTLDERHFRSMRPEGRRSFRILPSDA